MGLSLARIFFLEPLFKPSCVRTEPKPAGLGWADPAPLSLSFTYCRELLIIRLSPNGQRS